MRSAALHRHAWSSPCRRIEPAGNFFDYTSQIDACASAANWAHEPLWRRHPRAAPRSETKMRLGYFTMPVHPLHRNWAETLKEDREAIILADKHGFYHAFMGEHPTDACETITNSMMFHASLIPATARIKLATGTANLSHMHPVLIAVQA